MDSRDLLNFKILDFGNYVESFLFPYLRDVGSHRVVHRAIPTRRNHGK